MKSTENLEPIEKYKKSKNKDKLIWRDTFFGNYLRADTNKLMKEGSTNPLDFDKLFKVQEIFKFKHGYKTATERYIDIKDKHPRMPLIKIAKKIISKEMFIFNLMKWITNIFQIPIPFMIKWLLEWFSDEGAPWWEGYLYALFLAFGAYLLPLTDPFADSNLLKGERIIDNGLKVKFIFLFS